MRLTGKRVYLFLEDLYQEHEFWHPFFRLKEEGAHVVVVAPDKGREYKSKLGIPAVADEAARTVKVTDCSGIVIPGGYSPDLMRRDKAMVKLVTEAFGAGKIVAAICHAPWMLASADILKGKRCTSFFSIKDDLVHAGAEWVDEETVVDGNLITARRPDDLPSFMRAVIEGLENVS
jgi:protease I